MRQRVLSKVDALARPLTRRIGMVVSFAFRHLYWPYYRTVMKKRIDYWGCHILSADEGNSLIARLLESGEPTAIGKLGGVESEALGRYIENGGKPERWDTNTRLTLYRNAGVFPLDDGVFRRWCVEFLDSLSSLDLVAVWYNTHESRIIRRFATSAKLAELTSLEPYYHKNPWSRCLKGRKVLVIHPFEQSIRRQFLHRDKIWQDQRCLPDFELDTIKPPLSDALAKSGFQDWFDALQYMKTEISKKDFDVAIVGAGAYSLPLVAYIKRKGKSAIHLGGATQTLFGIKGRRWDNNAFFARSYNDYWSRPLEEETPHNAAVVEDGCYW
jgi:hypothetical protein